MARERINAFVTGTKKSENILESKQMQFLKLYRGIISSLTHRISIVNIKYQSICYMSQGLDCEDGKAAGGFGAY